METYEILDLMKANFEEYDYSDFKTTDGYYIEAVEDLDCCCAGTIRNIYYYNIDDTTRH